MEILDKKQEITNNKKLENNLNITFEKDIIKDSYSFYGFNSSFIIIESIDKKIYLIYTNIVDSIISYDLLNNQIKIEIKKPHNKHISNFGHYLDINNKIDLFAVKTGFI